MEEKFSTVDIVTAFLDENGYKRVENQGYDKLQRYVGTPSPGEYFLIARDLTAWIPPGRHPSDVTHLQLMCKHVRWDMCFSIHRNGRVTITMDLFALYSYDKIGPPRYVETNLANPKSFDILKRLL